MKWPEGGKHLRTWSGAPAPGACWVAAGGGEGAEGDDKSWHFEIDRLKSKSRADRFSVETDCLSRDV